MSLYGIGVDVEVCIEIVTPKESEDNEGLSHLVDDCSGWVEN